jgi:peptide/nickel transport system substrate-binding protein
VLFRSDPAARTGLIGQIQARVAEQLSTIPMLQGTQIAVVKAGVTGTADTLDGSFKFRYGAISAAS